MDSSWEDEFSSSRHVHNRGSRKPKSQTADIAHIFGVYEVQCAKAENMALGRSSPATRKKPKRQFGPRLAIQSFVSDEHGLVGTLHLPGVLDAEIYMSGSRKKLQEILDAENASEEEGSTSKEDSHEDEAESKATYDNADLSAPSEIATDSHDVDISAQEDKEQSRFKKFEKNTFRQPKFWFSWKGSVLVLPGNTAQSSAGNMQDLLPNELQSGMGYILFNGNGYKRFQGTISCELLEWINIPISGRKA
ncbi:hypothetical protein FPOA_05397 [Fusarium poae]|uniref:Uncharacterized protein n=1 Tax=Fusarium poae TaxID=36050 RepID=A0A1B8AWF9_FUSPO|nr:hypothetical protein FPOA_05397 [Fusarium poae]